MYWDDIYIEDGDDYNPIKQARDKRKKSISDAKEAMKEARRQERQAKRDWKDLRDYRRAEQRIAEKHYYNNPKFSMEDPNQSIKDVFFTNNRLNQGAMWDYYHPVNHSYVQTSTGSVIPYTPGLTGNEDYGGYYDRRSGYGDDYFDYEDRPTFVGHRMPIYPYRVDMPEWPAERPIKPIKPIKRGKSKQTTANKRSVGVPDPVMPVDKTYNNNHYKYVDGNGNLTPLSEYILDPNSNYGQNIHYVTNGERIWNMPIVNMRGRNKVVGAEAYDKAIDRIRQNNNQAKVIDDGWKVPEVYRWGNY